MSTPFAKHFQADGSYLWWQSVPGRYVDPGQYQLVEWLAAGGVPDEVPYVAPAEPSLADLRAAATERVRLATQAHIEATYPDWYQRNCALGVYPEASCEVCAAGIAECVEACNRVEDLIAVAADAGEIAAAESVLALPTITRSGA